MHNDWFDYLMILSITVIVAIAFWVLYSVIVVSNSPTFELHKSQWKCTKSETSTTYISNIIGKVSVLTPIISQQCNQYERI